jgi:uncharacterized membrane protein YfcA
MPFDSTTIIVAVSLLVAAYVKGLTGMGFPLIATPMVTLLLDIRTAVIILVIPNILMDLTLAIRTSSSTNIFRRFFLLFLMTVVGVFLGTKTLVMLPLWILNLSLAIMVLIFVVSNLFRPNYQISPRTEGILSPFAGFVGGFLNGMTNVGAPATAIYLYCLQLPKSEFIKSIATIFIVSKVVQLIAITTWNLFNPWNLSLSVYVTLFIMAGFYLGLKTQDRVNEKVFNRVLLALISLFGVALIVNALAY